MKDRLGVIFLILLAGGCLAASHNGYLVTVGPSPIRFNFFRPLVSPPEIDYNPAPAEMIVSPPFQIETNMDLKHQERQVVDLPEILDKESDRQTQSPAQQTETVSPQQTQTQQLQNNANQTETETGNQVIPPQVFVNYFKQNPFLKTNSINQIIVVPSFTPPPPAGKPSSSATYTIK